MKVVLLQTDICWLKCAENLRMADEMLERHVETDLFILPEMFSTGFCVEPQGVAEPEGGETLCWMKERARMFNCAIAGSVAIEENGKYYNRFYFVHPDGKVDKYDKRHLFTYGGEHRVYTPGSERVIVEYHGVRLLLQVCYDLRFPVWARNRKDYDVAIYVASWGEPRHEVWKTLLRARAIENQCYVIGVNRVGKDPTCNYRGGSMVIDPYGVTVASCGEEKACEVEAILDLADMDAFRMKFPVLKDADKFSL